MNEIIPAEDVATALADDYDLTGVVSATLLRRGFNDTYEVQTANGRYAARVYLAGKYYLDSDDDIRFELDLLCHLHAAAVSVSAPVTRRDGASLGSIVDASGATRPFALFTWAPGGPIEGTEDPAVARSYGATLGAIHAHADRFTSPLTRYRLNATYLVDQAERLLRDRFLAASDDRFANYEGAFAEMRAFLAAQPTEGPAFGYVHGDPHGRNVHVDDTGRVTFFDFDHGGFGWRAYDVVTAVSGVPLEHQAAFFDGYRSQHPLEESTEAELDRWMPIRMVWDIGDMMAMAPTRGIPFDASADDIVSFLDRVTGRWEDAAP